MADYDSEDYGKMASGGPRKNNYRAQDPVELDDINL
jgi:hypothetical protein